MKNGKFQCFAYAKNEKSDLHYFENLHSLAGRPARPTIHRGMRNDYRSACALTIPVKTSRSGDEGARELRKLQR